MTEHEKIVSSVLDTKPVIDGKEYPALIEILTDYILSKNGNDPVLAFAQGLDYVVALKEQTDPDNA